MTGGKKCWACSKENEKDRAEQSRIQSAGCFHAASLYQHCTCCRTEYLSLCTLETFTRDMYLRSACAILQSLVYVHIWQIDIFGCVSASPDRSTSQQVKNTWDIQHIISISGHCKLIGGMIKIRLYWILIMTWIIFSYIYIHSKHIHNF